VTYQCVMDDGLDVPIEADSAADAIQSALEKHPGHRVCVCYKGSRTKKGAGYVEYDVPRHDPMSVRAAPAAARVVQEAMFDDQAIRAESAAARERTNPQDED
jgi:hypothetical protein